jgi:ribosomal protein S18 acetylase RimI-like enzyme
MRTDPAGKGRLLLGMCVLYAIPWTYDLKPKLVMKELYVRESARGHGIGRALLQGAMTHARQCGASSLIWTVLKDNDRAKRFYRDNGASEDPIWDNWGVRL